MSTQIVGSRPGFLRRLTTAGLMFVGLLFAAEASGQGRGGMMNASPEERAAQRIGLLTERLSLTPQQVEQIQPILVKQFTEQVELFRKFQGGGDRQAMMNEMRELRTRHDEQILSVLTEEQKTAYRTLQEEERTRRMNRMNGGGGGGGQ
ncbi:MAG TPA: hypothetical protein VF167_16470 [Longimicrobiaceae bacterium]